MKARWFALPMAVAACAASAAAFVACASDDTPSHEDLQPPTNVIPGPDAAAGASPDAEADAAPFVCAPDELCPNGPFDPTSPGGGLDLRTRINVVRGRSASDVWAVGVEGVLVHYDGTSWTRSASGTKETFNGIWLRDSDEIALASLSSVYTHGLGAPDAGVSVGGWASAGAPPSPPSFANGSRTLESSWAAPGAEWLWSATVEVPGILGDPNVNGLWRMHVVAATSTLEIGEAFPDGTCGVFSCQQMTSVHGSSADDLWAVGYTGATIHITSAQSDTPSVTAFDSQTWVGLNGVWAASATEAWSVGGAGVIRHYTGGASSWDVVADVPTSETLHAVWGTSPTDVWAVGDKSVALHFDGKTWSRVNVAGTGDRVPDLYTVWSAAPGHVWIGGDGVLLSLGGKP